VHVESADDTPAAYSTAQSDAVFAGCEAAPGAAPAVALPAPPAASAPAKLKALAAYQHAAALFYGDEFSAARQAFDVIAATPGHPTRAWATLGALRSIVRAAVRDAEWDAAVEDAWAKRGLRGAAFKAAVAEPAARRNARVELVLKDIDARARAARADTTLAPVHAAVSYTARRALLQLAPLGPLAVAMNALDRLEQNPYTMGALDLFQETYPRVAPDRPEGALANEMRQHPWFDFIATVQACAEAPKPIDTVTCDAEHAHAAARWQETKDNAWPLAVDDGAPALGRRRSRRRRRTHRGDRSARMGEPAALRRPRAARPGPRRRRPPRARRTRDFACRPQARPRVGGGGAARVVRRVGSGRAGLRAARERLRPSRSGT
jgi:hypothetical protein